MNVTISFDEHRVRNTEKIEDIKVLMLKGEKGDAGMTPQDVIDIVDPLLDDYAPINSPAFTGTPTAPTATAGSDTTQIATTAYVKNEVDSKLSSTYKAKGSVTFANLPALTAANAGNVYNVTDAFTTTSDFVEGSGKSYPAGTNVVIINTTGSTYKYDVLSGFVDLSGYLTSSDAANTYLSQSDASSTYLTQSDASSTYLSQSSASSTYLTQSSASSTYATQTALGNVDAKVGSGTLDVGTDLIDAANTLNTGLTELNSNKANKSWTYINQLQVVNDSLQYPSGVGELLFMQTNANGGTFFYSCVIPGDAVPVALAIYSDAGHMIISRSTRTLKVDSNTNNSLVKVYYR